MFNVESSSDASCHRTDQFIREKVPLLCDNESAVKLANNPVQHSRTKHIDIRHHFLRDHVAKNDISLEGVCHRTDQFIRAQVQKQSPKRSTSRT